MSHVLIILSHRRNQIEKERDKRSTATFLEQNLEGMRRVEGPVLVIWHYRLHNTGNVVAEEYWLIKFFPMNKKQRHIKSHKAPNRFGCNKYHAYIRQVNDSLCLDVTSTSSGDLVNFELDAVAGEDEHLIKERDGHPICKKLRIESHQSEKRKQQRTIFFFTNDLWIDSLPEFPLMGCLIKEQEKNADVLD